jgi:hypothetical protein
MTKQRVELRYLSVRRADDGRITLHAATPSGAVRDVPISDLQAVVLVRDLANILTYSVQKAATNDSE